MQTFQLAQAQRILVVKLDEIGDFILATPFLRGLRKSAPRARIVLAVSPAVATMAEVCPHVDAVAIAQPDPKTGKIDLQALNESHLAVFQDCLKGGFDLAVVPRYDFDRYYASQLAKATGAKLVVGYSERVTPLKAERNKGFDQAYYTHVLTGSPGTHEVEHGLALLKFLGGAIDNYQVEAYAKAEDAAAADGLLAQIKARMGVDRLIAVAPGSSYPAKEYPPEKLAQVAAAVAEALNAGIVVLGGPGQQKLAEVVVNALPGRAESLCGKISLRHAVVVIARAPVLLSMCSGPGHIAAATSTPVVVFSCHPKDGDATHFHAPERFRPWSERVLTLRPEATVEPCKGTCTQAQESHCIASIDAEAAIDQVFEFLALPPRAKPAAKGKQKAEKPAAKPAAEKAPAKPKAKAKAKGKKELAPA